jgi:hypothetical protein
MGVDPKRLFRTRTDANRFVAKLRLAELKRKTRDLAIEYRRAIKLNGMMPKQFAFLGELRNTVSEGPILSGARTTLVGHKELAEALAFIETTLGVKQRGK